MQTYGASLKRIPTVRQVKRRQTVRAWSMVVVGTMIAAVFGIIAAKLVGGGISVLHDINPPQMPGGIVLFPLLLVIPAILRWPRATLVGLLAGSLVIDQFQYTIASDTPGGTVYKGPINVPLFRSLTTGSFITPFEIIAVILLVIWLIKGAAEHSWHVPRSPLAKSIATLFAVAVLVGLGLGLVHHGQFKESLWELRPWYYVAVVYLLTSALFAGRDVIQLLLWTLVLGSGAKSIEGVYNYFAIARHMIPRPDAILGHEESFFFGLFLLTALALWLFQIRGRLRTTATVLAPLVLIADLGNARRTAFLILYAGLAVLLVVAYIAMPDRRRALNRVNAVVLIGAVAYLGFFWNDSGTLGQPARAVHSAVAPTARDLSSDQYRIIENFDLEFNIHQTRSIGSGYGIPIDYIYSIVNLKTVDSMIAFVPHDGVLDMWFRLGILGEATMWSVIGFGILACCQLAKMGDRRTGAFGAIAMCAIVSYLLMGYNDLGFSWLRIAIFMGFMLGAVEVTRQRVDNARIAQDISPAEMERG
jgi:hypothetical protein